MDKDIDCEWNDERLLGIESIDKEHEQLFLMAKVLHRYMKEKATVSVINIFFGEVVKSAEAHFENEERFMKDKGFPILLLERHIVEHKKLLERLLGLKKKFEKGEITLTDEVAQLLTFLLSGHMQEYDTRIAEFVNK